MLWALSAGVVSGASPVAADAFLNREGKLEVRVENRINRSISCDVGVRADGLWGPEEQERHLSMVMPAAPVAQLFEARLPNPPEPVRSAALVLAGVGQETTSTVVPLRLMTAPRLRQAPALDGDLTEWKDVPSLVLGTADDVGPQPGRTRWRGADDLWAQAGAALKIGAADLTALRADYWSQETIDHELTRYLQSLRPRYRVGLLSNAWNDTRAALIQKYHLDKVMDTIVISAEEGMAKPDLRIYRLAAERLEVAPRECIFVDDRAGNVTGAEAAGMKGVVFAATPQAIAAIQYHLGHS
jgi:HAD superfamily hydrolase (TIGR01509 family)